MNVSLNNNVLWVVGPLLIFFIFPEVIEFYRVGGIIAILVSVGPLLLELGVVIALPGDIVLSDVALVEQRDLVDGLNRGVTPFGTVLVIRSVKKTSCLGNIAERAKVALVDVPLGGDFEVKDFPEVAQTVTDAMLLVKVPRHLKVEWRIFSEHQFKFDGQLNDRKEEGSRTLNRRLRKYIRVVNEPVSILSIHPEGRHLVRSVKVDEVVPLNTNLAEVGIREGKQVVLVSVIVVEEPSLQANHWIVAADATVSGDALV